MTSINLTSYIDELRSSAPTPGGGSASCIVGALACAQAHMLCALALERKNLFERSSVQLYAEKLLYTESRFYELAKADAHAYALVDSALKMLKTTESEKKKRTEKLQESLFLAADAPLKALYYTREALAIVSHMVGATWARSAISDVSVAASFFEAAAYGFQATILANTHWMKDPVKKKQLIQDAKETVCAIKDEVISIREQVETVLS